MHGIQGMFGERKQGKVWEARGEWVGMGRKGDADGGAGGGREGWDNRITG